MALTGYSRGTEISLASRATESPNWANNISRLSVKSVILDWPLCSTATMPPMWMGYCSPTSSADTLAEAIPVSEVVNRIPGVSLAATVFCPWASNSFS